MSSVPQYIRQVCVVVQRAPGSEDDVVAELRGFWSDDDWSKASKKKERYVLLTCC